MTAMPVQHHPDVPGETVAIEPVEEISFVDAVEETEGHIETDMVLPPRDCTVRAVLVELGGVSHILSGMDRMTLGRMQNPIRGLLHGAAAVATLGGTVYLVARAWGSTMTVVGSVVFGFALLVMYTVSSLYHSVPWGPAWKRRLQRADHSMIYLVVAGTFTPIAIAALEGGSLWWCLGLVWGIAAVGIVLKLALVDISTGLSVTLQLVMGWMVIFWLPQIWTRLGPGAIALIALGGVCYTVGVVFFLTKRPRLFPRTFSYHELFHVFVVLASVFHFLAVVLYALPASV